MAFYRQAGYARTFKEIQAVVADAPQKDIAKCYKFLISDVKEKVEMVTPASLVRRFCAVLGLGLKEVKAAEEMARTAVPSEDSARCVKGAAMMYSWSHKSINGNCNSQLRSQHTQEACSMPCPTQSVP